MLQEVTDIFYHIKMNSNKGKTVGIHLREGLIGIV